MSQETHQQRVSVLLSEYQRVCNEIRGIESNNEKVVGFGLTLISIGFVSGLAQNIAAVYLILPPAIIGVLFYGAMTYTNVFSLAGYKRYLEDELNAALERPTLFWEALVLKREQWNAARIGLLLVYVLVSVAVISVSVHQIWLVYGKYWMAAMLGVVVFLTLLLLLGVRKMGSINDQTYSASKELSAPVPDEKLR